MWFYDLNPDPKMQFWSAVLKMTAPITHFCRDTTSTFQYYLSDEPSGICTLVEVLPPGVCDSASRIRVQESAVMPESGVRIPSSKYSRIEELIKIRAFDRLDLLCGNSATFNNFPSFEKKTISESLHIAYMYYCRDDVKDTRGIYHSINPRKISKWTKPRFQGTENQMRWGFQKKKNANH